ncbi:MAG: HlyD family efflux transporter periplasmic adaptor subunit [Patescibacteria group bacterium]|jgi:RND family efflux transporter MFP subunit
MFTKRRKTKITLLFILVLAVLAVIFFAFQKPVAPQYETAKIERVNLVQTVKEVGSVKSAEEIKLSFPLGGKLAEKFINLGDLVKKDQVIAELDYSAATIERANAVSNLLAAKASLGKLLTGSTRNEISVLEAQSGQAQKAYEAAVDNLNKTQKTVAEEIRQAEKNLNDLTDTGAGTITTYEASLAAAKINLASAEATYQKVIDNAVETSLLDDSAKLSVGNAALDNVDKMLTDDDIKNTLSAKNKTYLNNAKNGYTEAESFYSLAATSLTTALTDKSETSIKKASDDILFFLKKTAYVLDNSYIALENSTMSQTLMDSYKTLISTQTTYNNTAIGVVQGDRQSLDNAYLSYNTNISSAQNSLNQAQAAFDNALLAAQNSLSSTRLSGEARLSTADSNVKTSRETAAVASRQLTQLNSPARSEDVVLAQAKVDQAQASLDLADKKIEDSLLKSPIDGKLIRSIYEVGEQVPTGQTAFSVLKENSFEIEVDISESDIAKIKVGDEVEITLDAFGEGQKFSGQVIFIEPAETIIQEVVYYKVKIGFAEDDERLTQVKSGMTANVAIFAGRREGVLAAPERAILEKSGQKIIRILRQGVLTEVRTETGLRGDDGLIELLSGVKEGEEAVVFIKTSSKN